MKRKMITGALFISASLFFLKIISYKKPIDHKKMVIVIDPLLADNFKNHLQACFKEQQKISGHFDLFIKYLKERYPSLKIVTSTNNQHHTLFKIKADRPTIIINTHSCLTESGKIAPVKQYQETIISQLPALTVKDNNNNNNKLVLSDACLRFIKKIDKQVLKEYNLTWHDEQNITLQDKKTRYSFIITHQELLNQQFFTTIQAIKNENTVQPKRYCSVDMRFKNQIIVKNNRGQWG